jgi:hypothetical protein
MNKDCERLPVPIEGDSWSNWEPDPERSFREHNAALEPYALMSREEILECMRDARGGKEWEFLTEFLLDKCGYNERRWERVTTLLTSYLEFGRAELWFAETAARATRMTGRENEPPGC